MKKKLHNVTHLTLYIAHLIAITTGFQLFAVPEAHGKDHNAHGKIFDVCSTWQTAHSKQHTTNRRRQKDSFAVCYLSDTRQRV